MTFRFKVGDIVEQKNTGDTPHFVAARTKGSINRYTLESITETVYEGIPEYLIVPARPPEQSKYGKPK